MRKETSDKRFQVSSVSFVEAMADFVIFGYILVDSSHENQLVKDRLVQCLGPGPLQLSKLEEAQKTSPKLKATFITIK